MADENELFSHGIVEPLTSREVDILSGIAEGLTNQEIADQLFLAEKTVRWYNTQIFEKLGVKNRREARRQAQRLGLIDQATVAQNERIRHNLPPQPTDFVGRANELQDLWDLFTRPANHIVTLLASGGMGKTRLALATAQTLLPHFQHGVFLVPLAPLRSRDEIAPAIADHVGFQIHSDARPEQQVLDYFKERHTMLILDNFEHLLSASAFVSALATNAPDIRLLVTSREKLNIRGEVVYTLGGMSFPDGGVPEDVLRYDAARLFEQSARMTRPNFAIEAANLNNLARICTLTGGMPLAIELAAGWVDTLSLKQIAEEIQQGIDILETDLRDIPVRHRSIRATLNQTWARLSNDEQAVFMKLSVFRDGFTREAAEAVANASLSMLRRLVHKALLHPSSQERFDMHDLIRQFGAEQLALSGEIVSIKRSHCLYFAGLLQQRVDDLKGRRQYEAASEILADFDNIRVAWSWALAQADFESLRAMQRGLHHFWYVRFDKGRDLEILFQPALTWLSHSDSSGDERLWGRLQTTLIETGYCGITNYDGQRDLLKESLSIARRHQDWIEIGLCQYLIGFVDRLAGHYDRVLPMFAESLATFEDIGDDYYVGRVLRHMVWHYEELGSAYWERATTLNQRLKELVYRIGDKAGVSTALGKEAQIKKKQGKIDEAETLILRQAQLETERGVPTAGMLVDLADISLLRGDLAKAQQQLEDAIGQFSDHNRQFPLVQTQFRLGVVAALQEDYKRAAELSQPEDRHLAFYLQLRSELGLTMAAVGLGNDRVALELVRTVLKRCHEQGWSVERETWLVLAAIVLARQGDDEFAVQLFGSVFSVSFGPATWMRHWPLLTRLQEYLEATLGSESYDAAWERGTHLDQDTIVVDLIETFEGSQKSVMPRG